MGVHALIEALQLLGMPRITEEKTTPHWSDHVRHADAVLLESADPQVAASIRLRRQAADCFDKGSDLRRRYE